MTFDFAPIETERLLLRPPRLDDADSIYAYRNDPEVARYQDWTLPVDRAAFDARLAAGVEQGGPIADGSWNLTIADRRDTLVLGDVYIGLRWGARSAVIGYTLASAHQGQGFASEAVRAVLAWLFETVEVIRVEGTMHPDNLRSAMLLERQGFRFEGMTRDSFWVGDELSSDTTYGLTRADWDAWQSRHPGAPSRVELVEVTEANQHAVRRLQVHQTQQRLVAPVVASMADALFPEIIDGAPVLPWMRAVEADGELAAFVMVAMVTDAHPEPYLWRLLVDRMHQHRGIGRAILDLVVDRVRADGATSLLTSWVDGPGSPRRFYERIGFVPTGEIVDGEIEARLTFD